MADTVLDGRMNVWLVPTIPAIASPVAATIAAGNAIELLLTPEGLAGFESTTNWVDNSPLGGTFDTKLPGTVSFGDMSLEFKWQSGTDAMWTLLQTGYETNVVVRAGLLRATAIAATQQVEVYPITCGEYTRLPYERNSLKRFRIPIGLRDQPNLRAVVV